MSKGPGNVETMLTSTTNCILICFMYIMFQILLVHEASKGSFSRVFDFEANDLSEDESMSRTR